MMVDRALTWSLHHLDLFQASDSPHSRVQTTWKPLLELTLLGLLSRRHEALRTDERIAQIVATSSTAWKAGHGLDRLVRNPDAFRLYALWHEALVHTGGLGDEGRAVIQAVVDHGYVTATEDVGFRDLDLRHVLDLGGYQHRLPSYRSLYRQTVLGRGGPPLSFTHIDAYSVTHSLFYLTDFGARPIDAIPRRDVSRVRWTVELLLSRYLVAEDWDLVAELLLSAVCLRWTPPAELYHAAWDGLLNAQRDDGAIPSRSFAERSIQQLPVADRRVYEFEHTYHTTLAATIAGFTADLAPHARPRSRHRLRARARTPWSTRWQSVSDRAARWFGSLRDRELTPHQRLQVLVGLWLTSPHGTGAMSCEVDGRLAAAARAASDMLCAVDMKPTTVAALDPSLLLCAAAILRSLGHANPVLEEYASRLSTELSSVREPLDVETSVDLAPARHLLAALGVAPQVDPPSPQKVLAAYCAKTGPEVFKMDATARARVTRACLAASAFGHRQLSDVAETVRLAVATWAMISLQRCRLEEGSQFLRACGALFPRQDPWIAAGVEFLMLHQRHDGAFGFLAPECATLSTIRPDLRADLDITLVTTVAVVWCLAELLTPTRLFPAAGVRRSGPRGSPTDVRPTAPFS